MGIVRALKSIAKPLHGEPLSAHQIAKISRKLRSLHLGFELFLGDSPFTAENSPWILGFGETPGEWCLAVRPAPGKELAADLQPIPDTPLGRICEIAPGAPRL